MKKCLTICLFLLPGIGLFAQDPGDLFNTFSGDGYFIENWNDTATTARDIGVTSDGNLLVAGNLKISNTSSFLLMMDNEGNSLYGNSPRGFVTDFTVHPEEGATALCVLPDDKVLFAGYYFTAAYHPYVVRMLPDGQIDESFGSAGIFYGTSLNMDVLDMAVYTTGSSYKILICGTNADHHPQIVMINDDGTLFTDFGSGGISVFAESEGSFKNLSVDSENNALYATGFIGDASGTIIAKYNLPAGDFNNDFGTNGRLIYPSTTFNGAPLAHVLDIENNTLTLFGGYLHPDGDYDIFAYRMNAVNGNADGTFGASGWAWLRNAGVDEEITAAAIQADGKYYFSGYYNAGTDNNIFVGRINHNGTPDNTFGTNGLVLAPAAYEQYVKGMALSPRENVLYITGTNTDGSNESIFLVAYCTGFETEPEPEPEPEYTPFIVTNTADDGEGSLRKALIDADFNAGPDTIIFNIPITDPGYDDTKGVWTIQVLTETMFLENDSTVIDATTQTTSQGDRNSQGPEIEITGLDAVSTCFQFNGSGNEIKGFAINQFSMYAIAINDDNAKVTGNYIGTDVTGTSALPNGHGIHLGYAAKHCVIGGSTAEERNLISGNVEYGIVIQSPGTDSNMVKGNYIGTDRTGEVALGNGEGGIYLLSGPAANIIGGTAAVERNIISASPGNGTGSHWYGNGIVLNAADSNIIIGNYIGTNYDASAALPNEAYGIHLVMSHHNIIGGTTPGEGNVISGNKLGGVFIYSINCDSNIVSGNFIGTDGSGLAELHNNNYGIYISYGAEKNQIGPGNIISYNSSHGVFCSNENTRMNTITQNVITHNGALGIRNENGANNSLTPAVILEVTTDKVTGTACAGCRVEVFSDELDEGAIFEGYTDADDEGNFEWTGTATGPYFTATATDADGNTSEFSEPFDTSSGYHVPCIVTNTNDSGEGSLRQAMADADENPGADSVVFNIPASDPGYNSTTGVWTIQLTAALEEVLNDSMIIDGATQTISQGDNNPQGPEIEISGTGAVDYGLVLSGHSNTVKNLIVNGFLQGGIFIKGHHNKVTGSFIGCDASGTQPVPNGYGIQIVYGAKHTIIGGNTAEKRNLISGNRFHGIMIAASGTDSTLIQGNFIGTDYAGEDTVCNAYGGIHLVNEAGHTIVGGTTAGERNIICGANHSGNIYMGNGITIENSDNNRIVGNYIGTNKEGTIALPNIDFGVAIAKGEHNQVGGPNPGEGNVISGNGWGGIFIRFSESMNNTIEGNLIGTDVSGSGNLGNNHIGIQMDYGAHDNTVGPSNAIMHNGDYGIQCSFDTTFRNTITQNSIADHQELGIFNEDGANGSIAVPEILNITSSGVTGTACASCTVEIFSDETDEGAIFEGSTAANASGSFTWTGTVSGPYVTATVTDTEGNTSQFSVPYEVSATVSINDAAATQYLCWNRIIRIRSANSQQSGTLYPEAKR